MKKILPLALLTVGLLTSGCLVYERRSPERVVVQETVGPSPQVVTVLPAGYRTRSYRGVDYYESGNVYYRTDPAGRYVVVPRPW